MASYPSIFNDVIGPVMRGPSSSHCAASLRIGRICRDLMGGQFSKILIEFDPNGSLATTHESQGSDMGLFGGFLGWEAHDERLETSGNAIKAAGIDVEILIQDIGAEHPNTYKFTLESPNRRHELTALSTGGGMIEIIEVDGQAVMMEGDYFETLVYSNDGAEIVNLVENMVPHESYHVTERFVQIKSQKALEDDVIDIIRDIEGVEVRSVDPVLPIMSRQDTTVPYDTCASMLEYNKDKGLELWELAVHYESARGNISHEEVIRMMGEIVDIMQNAVDTGLKGTDHHDRILGAQSVGFKEKLEANKLLQGNISNTIIMFVSAIMEVKSSMGVIVAAPTAGSCGALPGAILGAAHCLGLDRDEVVKIMLASSVTGLFIASRATFAAEVGGCQAECGSGAGMAAAGLTYMGGGTLDQSLSAASLALQNSLGMICDPIANRVEAPCLGKNVMAATNALSCANMALANYDHLIPLDEVVDTMDAVGKAIDSSLRCTALGGLAITKTAKEIEARLGEQNTPAFKSC